MSSVLAGRQVLEHQLAAVAHNRLACVLQATPARHVPAVQFQQELGLGVAARNVEVDDQPAGLRQLDRKVGVLRVNRRLRHGPDIQTRRGNHDRLGVAAASGQSEPAGRIGRRFRMSAVFRRLAERPLPGLACGNKHAALAQKEYGNAGGGCAVMVQDPAGDSPAAPEPHDMAIDVRHARRGGLLQDWLRAQVAGRQDPRPPAATPLDLREEPPFGVRQAGSAFGIAPGDLRRVLSSMRPPCTTNSSTGRPVASSTTWPETFTVASLRGVSAACLTAAGGAAGEAVEGSFSAGMGWRGAGLESAAQRARPRRVLCGWTSGRICFRPTARCLASWRMASTTCGPNNSWRRLAACR